ncbi:hypothetical protein D3C75_735260 [compost metagenome]
MAQPVGQVLGPQHFGGRDNGKSELQAGQINYISNNPAWDHDEYPVALLKAQPGQPARQAVGLLHEVTVGDFFVISVLLQPLKRNLIGWMMFHFRSEIVEFRCNPMLIVQDESLLM